MTIIETYELTKTYSVGDVSIHALQGVSLMIRKGEFISIMGPSGSGKSTLMNILGCLDTPTNGAYHLEGLDVSGLSRDSLADIRRRKVGFVFQGFNLLPRTSALENVELPLLYSGLSSRERSEKAAEALSKVGLEGRENHRPSQLSGGQQQRVAIARAIVNNALIILADEPTGNIDTKTSAEIMDIFVRLNSTYAITIILVTHEYDIASYGKRIIGFLDGRIIRDVSVDNNARHQISG